MTTDSPAIDDRLYTGRFFQVFAAVMLFMTGAALQFHFGQYFEFLGHDIDTLGLVAGISVFGTLAIRLHVGNWIDRLGCRPTWVAGSALAATAALSIQFVENLVLIVILRTAWNMAFAMVMTTVAVVAARIAPPHRRAESLGSMGLAGFTGMIVGPTLGDYIFSGDTAVVGPYRVFFTASAMFVLASGVLVLLMPTLRGQVGPTQGPSDGQRGESVLKLLMTHWSGAIMLVGLAFSMAFSLHMIFLERLAEHTASKNIKIFFLVYAPTAITLRLIFRRVPERLGRTRAVVGGLLLWTGGICCLIGLKSQWQLALPAFLMGAGHCFVFPSMIDLAAERLPADRRGMGTAMIMGAGDLGLLIGFVLLGEVFEHYGFDRGLLLLATLVLLSTVVFAISRWEHLARRTRQATAIEPPPPVA
jgi:MFS family permease